MPILSPSHTKVLGALGMGVVWMSARGVEGNPQPIGSVPPQTLFVGDSLSIPFYPFELFTDYDSIEIVTCSLASCELEGGSETIGTAPTGFSIGIGIQENYAYVGTSTNDDFQVVDISNPLSPNIVHTVNIGSGAEYGVATKGNYAFVGASRLEILNITDPLSASVVSSAETGGCNGVVIVGNYAYVAANGGLRVVDISDPLSPEIVATFSTGTAWGVDVRGNYAYVATSNGLQIVDISDLSNTSPPFPNVNTGKTFEGVVSQGNYAYIAADNGGLEIVDVSDPLSPFLVSSGSDTGSSYAIAVEGNYAYTGGFRSDLRILDISNPSSPSLVGVLEIASEKMSVWGITLKGNYAYLGCFQDLNNGLPGLVVFSFKKELLITANVADRNEESIWLRGCNPSGECSEPLEIQVNVPNRPPQVNPLGISSPVFIVKEDPFTYSFGENAFVDEDGDPLELSATLSDGSPLPSTIQFLSESFSLQGTLSSSQVVRFQANDPFGGIAFFDVELQVGKAKKNKKKSSKKSKKKEKKNKKKKSSKKAKKGEKKKKNAKKVKKKSKKENKEKKKEKKAKKSDLMEDVQIKGQAASSPSSMSSPSDWWSFSLVQWVTIGGVVVVAIAVAVAVVKRMRYPTLSEKSPLLLSI